MAEPVTDDVKGRIVTLEGRWKQTDQRLEHLDGRVSSLAVDMSAIKAGMDTLVKGFDGISTRASQPTNWIAVASLIITSVVVGSQYVDLRIQPLDEEITHNRAIISEMTSTLQNRGAIIGQFQSSLGEIQDWRKHEDDRRHKLEDDVIHLREQAAAAEVSRRAMGDYLRQVDEMGSRAWINKPPGHASKVE